MDEKVKYIFIKLYFDLDGVKIDSLVIEVFFLESGVFSKYYLFNLKKDNLEFLKYIYINKNGVELDLLFDIYKNKYYVIYNYIKDLKINVLEFNYIGNR